LAAAANTGTGIAATAQWVLNSLLKGEEIVKSKIPAVLILVVLSVAIALGKHPQLHEYAGDFRARDDQLHPKFVGPNRHRKLNHH